MRWKEAYISKEEIMNKVVELLIKNKNRYVSYEEIENYVWSDSVMTKDALKTLVKNIKIKISKDLILNLTNSGYKIDV